MLDKYKELFKIYLKILKEMYDDKKPYENLEECCEKCERFSLKLSGMVELMRDSNLISEEESEKEQQNIIHTFSTHDLFNAFMQDGEVMVWHKI